MSSNLTDSIIEGIQSGFENSEARFYTCQIENTNRFWWQTMERNRMKELLKNYVSNPSVTDENRARCSEVLKLHFSNK